MTFSPDGKSIATGTLTGSIQIWGVEDGQSQKTLSGPLTEITSLAFSQNGNLLAAGGADGSIYVIEIATQAPRIFSGQTARIHT
jgi:WD40 repeat protein